MEIKAYEALDVSIGVVVVHLGLKSGADWALKGNNTDMKKMEFEVIANRRCYAIVHAKCQNTRLYRLQ